MSSSEPIALPYCAVVTNCHAIVNDNAWSIWTGVHRHQRLPSRSISICLSYNKHCFPEVSTRAPPVVVNAIWGEMSVDCSSRSQRRRSTNRQKGEVASNSRSHAYILELKGWATATGRADHTHILPTTTETMATTTSTATAPAIVHIRTHVYPSI